uniref:Uncharacterized protein n=1 Tax=Alfalfa mosaic virus TaxID=12321 RepID=Q8V5Y1_AMV|nr:unknown [Alfalfa mosaic virus]
MENTKNKCLEFVSTQLTLFTV